MTRQGTTVLGCLTVSLEGLPWPWSPSGGHYPWDLSLRRSTSHWAKCTGNLDKTKKRCLPPKTPCDWTPMTRTPIFYWVGLCESLERSWRLLPHTRNLL